MSKKEQVKFDLEFLKNAFAIVLTAIFAVVGYGIANIEALSKIQFYVGSAVLLVLVVALAFITKGLVASRRKIKEL